jgi:hypothetical protein
MSSHLPDEQLVASALGESDRATALHLHECSQCREEIQSLRGAIGVWIKEIDRGSGASEAFWRRQREAIAARLARRTLQRPWKHVAWATATLTLVLLAASVFHRHPSPAGNKAPVDDNALLLSIHSSVTSDVPRALEPATLLVQEIARADEARPTTSE